jgi:hypothetical protein
MLPVHGQASACQDAILALACACERHGSGFHREAGFFLLTGSKPIPELFDPATDGHLARLKAVPEAAVLSGSLSVWKPSDVLGAFGALADSGELRLVSNLYCLTAAGIARARALGLSPPEHPQPTREEILEANLDRKAPETSGLSLTVQQHAAIALARKGKTMFITGSAGSGKSLTLSHIVRGIRKDHRAVFVAVSLDTVV